jgi:hypothetical protein
MKRHWAEAVWIFLLLAMGIVILVAEVGTDGVMTVTEAVDPPCVWCSAFDPSMNEDDIVWHHNQTHVRYGKEAPRKKTVWTTKNGHTTRQTFRQELRWVPETEGALK